MLTADGSVRYDHYGNQNVGGGDSKATYKVGLEFRPFESLLFRGNYATAFRAPDMAYTFGGQSGFFQGGNTDYYRCALAGGPLEQLPVFRIHAGPGHPHRQRRLCSRSPRSRTASAACGRRRRTST